MAGQGVVPIDLTLSGGDAGPAVSETGAVNISQTGMNIPAYPDFYSLSPVDADSQPAPIINRQDQTMFYALMGGVLLIAIIKRLKK